MNSEQIKVLIVDDSKVSRDLMGYIVGLDHHIDVIGYAENGADALQFIEKNRPDVIITDIEMPVMNGFQLTRKIMESDPIPIIVISGAYNQAEVAVGFEAIDAGALAIIEKPKGLGDSQCMDTARFVAETIKTMSKVTMQRDTKSIAAQLYQKDHSPLPPVEERYCSKTTSIKAVAIGASIGGPKAIRTLLAQLPTRFNIPIFVVQHITSGFIDGFVNWLNNSTTFTVKIADQGEIPLPNIVYICPDKKLMEIDEKGRIALTPINPSEKEQNSISALFTSLHKKYGKDCAAILLTGIGKDGVKELLHLRSAGATTIVQDDKTSVKFELPKEAIDIGAAELILPLPKIAASLKQLVTKE